MQQDQTRHPETTHPRGGPIDSAELARAVASDADCFGPIASRADELTDSIRRCVEQEVSDFHRALARLYRGACDATGSAEPDRGGRFLAGIHYAGSIAGFKPPDAPGTFVRGDTTLTVEPGSPQPIGPELSLTLRVDGRVIARDASVLHTLRAEAIEARTAPAALVYLLLAAPRAIPGGTKVPPAPDAVQAAALSWAGAAPIPHALPIDRDALVTLARLGIVERDHDSGGLRAIALDRAMRFLSEYLTHRIGEGHDASECWGNEG